MASMIRFWTRQLSEAKQTSRQGPSADKWQSRSRVQGQGLGQREGEPWSCPRRSGGVGGRCRGRLVASPLLSCVTAQAARPL